jgi:hypothetical protein
MFHLGKHRVGPKCQGGHLITDFRTECRRRLTFGGLVQNPILDEAHSGSARNVKGVYITTIY